MLAFEAVTRRYGAVRALDGVSFALEPGTMTALVGPNGAGKTTLLRLAATLDAPSAGRILVDGLDAAHAGAQARRRVAWLGQEPGLYEDLTVRENLAFLAAFHGKSHAVEGAAARLGVEELLAKRVRVLSRGQRQRAALARALVAGELILLDEPTTALDEAARDAAIRALRAERGARTILAATHDADLVAASDRVLRLDAGRLSEVRA